MGFLDRFRDRRSGSAMGGTPTGTDAGTQSATDGSTAGGSIPAAEEARLLPAAAWPALPPIQRAVAGGTSGVADPGFGGRLATWQNPSFTGTLSHAVLDGGLGSLVGDLLSSRSHPAAPLPQSFPALPVPAPPRPADPAPQPAAPAAPARGIHVFAAQQRAAAAPGLLTKSAPAPVQRRTLPARIPSGAAGSAPAPSGTARGTDGHGEGTATGKELTPGPDAAGVPTPVPATERRPGVPGTRRLQRAVTRQSGIHGPRISPQTGGDTASRSAAHAGPAPTAPASGSGTPTVRRAPARPSPPAGSASALLPTSDGAVKSPAAAGGLPPASPSAAPGASVQRAALGPTPPSPAPGRAPGTAGAAAGPAAGPVVMRSTATGPSATGSVAPGTPRAATDAPAAVPACPVATPTSSATGSAPGVQHSASGTTAPPRRAGLGAPTSRGNAPGTDRTARHPGPAASPAVPDTATASGAETLPVSVQRATSTAPPPPPAPDGPHGAPVAGPARASIAPADQHAFRAADPNSGERSSRPEPLSAVQGTVALGAPLPGAAATPASSSMPTPPRAAGTPAPAAAQRPAEAPVPASADGSAVRVRPVLGAPLSARPADTTPLDALGRVPVVQRTTGSRGTALRPAGAPLPGAVRSFVPGAPPAPGTSSGHPVHRSATQPTTSAPHSAPPPSAARPTVASVHGPVPSASGHIPPTAPKAFVPAFPAAPSRMRNTQPTAPAVRTLRPASVTGLPPTAARGLRPFPADVTAVQRRAGAAAVPLRRTASGADTRPVVHPGHAPAAPQHTDTAPTGPLSTAPAGPAVQRRPRPATAPTAAPLGPAAPVAAPAASPASVSPLPVPPSPPVAQESVVQRSRDIRTAAAPPPGGPPPAHTPPGSPPPHTGGAPPPAYAEVPQGGFDPRSLTDFQLDELTHRLTGRITRLLRTELRLDRERVGRLRDPRR
ncbi:hypothetical protein [Streptomyces sp. CA-106131]|uniref:hypothetical protein n=1 Tax=Streptomyces sp. CA-106131 TaxID=3240045 RepID=UPI003D8DDDD3